MNKQKGALTLKDLNSFKAVRGYFNVLNEIYYNPLTPDIPENPEDFSNIEPKVRKAIEQGKPF